MLSKIYALFIVLFMTMPTARAVVFDITNDPNLDFFIGYKKNYGSDCFVHIWQSKTENVYLMSVGDCEKVTSEEAYNDLIRDMNRVQKVSKAKNFIEYKTELDKEKNESMGHQFCIDKIDYVLIFTKAPATNKKGWNYIAYNRYSRYGSVNKMVGFWKKSDEKNVIADFGQGPVLVDKAKAFHC